MLKRISAVLFALAVVFAFTVTARAALVDNLDGTITDTDLGIMWLQDANLAASNTFGVAGINSLGGMYWDTANAWIAAMNAANYLGYSDWRLPTALNQDGSGPCQLYDCTGSEMGHMFYTEMGGTAGSSILTTGDPDLALFEIGGTQTILPRWYWSSTELASAPALTAWGFYFGDGQQNWGGKFTNTNHIWAVRSVPEPSTILLLGSALAGLAVWRRRLRRKAG